MQKQAEIDHQFEWVEKLNDMLVPRLRGIRLPRDQVMSMSSKDQLDQWVSEMENIGYRLCEEESSSDGCTVEFSARMTYVGGEGG